MGRAGTEEEGEEEEDRLHPRIPTAFDATLQNIHRFTVFNYKDPI